MPQLETANYIPQLFWLVVTFVALYIILSRAVLPRIGEVLENRQAHIDHDLERATALQEESRTVMDSYEAELAAARSKAQREIAAIREAAAKDAAAQQGAVEQKLAADLAAAEERIAASRARAFNNVSEIAIELAESATQRLSGIKVSAADLNAAVEQSK